MSRKRTRTFRAIVYVAAAVLVFASGLALAQQDAVVVIQGSDPTSLDPIRDTSLPSINVSENLFDSLVVITDDLTLKPGLATSWERLGPTEWVFNLRQGVTFHDGTPFNAEAAKFTLDRIMNPDNQAAVASQMSAVERVEVVDEYTLRVVTKYPMTPLLNAAFTTTYFVSPTAVRSMGDQAFGLAAVGTGPYRFVEWVRDDHLTLAANPDYWGGEPEVKTLIFRPVREAATAASLLVTGEADIVLNFSPALVDMVEQSSVATIKRVHGLAKMHIVIDTAQPPLDLVEVRQALNYAVDKDAIVEGLLEGNAVVTAGLIHEMLLGHNPDLVPYPYDPDRARELLAAAGYPNGFDLDFRVSQGRYVMDKEIAEAVAGQLAEVGIRVNVIVEEWTQLLPRMRQGEINGLGYFTCIALRADPDHCYASAVYSKGTFPHNFSTPELDQMIEAGRQEADVTAREALYRSMEEYTREQAPWIFMFDMVNLTGVSNRIDWNPSVHNYVRAKEIRLQ